MYRNGATIPLISRRRHGCAQRRLEHQSCSKQERTFMAIRFGNAVSCAKSLMGVVLLILLYAGFGHSQADSGSPDGEPIAPAKTPATPPPPTTALLVRQ